MGDATPPSQFSTGYTIEDGVTQSLLYDWLDCRERARLILDGWEKIGRKKTALTWGTRFHYLLEVFYTALASKSQVEREEILNEIESALNDWENMVRDEDDSVQVIRLGEVFHGYGRKWLSDDSERTWLSMEYKFDKKVRRLRRRGIGDAIFRNSTGHLVLLETKTGAQLDQTEIELRYTYDPQVHFYIDTIEHILGEPISQVLVNFIRRPGINVKQTESFTEYRKRLRADVVERADFYYQRYVSSLDEEHRARWREEFRHTAAEYKHWVAGRRKTFRNPSACFKKWRCEFAEACSQNSMDGYSQTRELFEELA